MERPGRRTRWPPFEFRFYPQAVRLPARSDRWPLAPGVGRWSVPGALRPVRYSEPVSGRLRLSVRLIAALCRRRRSPVSGDRWVRVSEDPPPPPPAPPRDRKVAESGRPDRRRGRGPPRPQRFPLRVPPPPDAVSVS